MLEVSSLKKSFDDFLAVNGANLYVGKGDIVAVIGPNGAGKTTLFNLITGHLRPDGGRVLFKGKDITGLAPYALCRLGISRSFQIVNIFSRLTVFENVQVAVLSHQRKTYTFLRPSKGMANKETQEILEVVGLGDKAHRISGYLSHGDQKILEIAIALGNNPELLVLDEPTAGMSPEETQSTIELIKRLATERGITILFCEHDMDIVFGIAKSIMVMTHGRTIVQGPPSEVRENKEVQEAYLGMEHA